MTESNKDFEKYEHILNEISKIDGPLYYNNTDNVLMTSSDTIATILINNQDTIDVYDNLIHQPLIDFLNTHGFEIKN